MNTILQSGEKEGLLNNSNTLYSVKNPPLNLPANAEPALPILRQAQEGDPTFSIYRQL